MFTITQAMSKWHQHLLGWSFTIFTNQQSLRNLTNQTIQLSKQQNWLSKLGGYDFQIIYCQGKLSQVIDAISHPFDTILMDFSSQSYVFEKEPKAPQSITLVTT